MLHSTSSRVLRSGTILLNGPTWSSLNHTGLARNATTLSHHLLLPTSNLIQFSGSNHALYSTDDTSRRTPEHFNSTNIPGSPDFGANQDLIIDDETKQRLKAILNTFNAPVRYAIAYGSGVFQQRGYEKKKAPMIDFIFGVSHPQHWHSLNLQHNRAHYSFMGTLGSRAISVLQENVGAGVYFNPYVEIDGMYIKYGVISIEKLCKDLLDWETLYVAGRMHKPVKILRDDARVRLANQVNLTSALRLALLLLPENFSEEELYLKIASISYQGDFRMRVGENPNKIRNIVAGQIDHFRRLYSGLIEDLPNVIFIRDEVLQQDPNPRIRGLMIQKLPKLYYGKVRSEHERWSRSKGIEVPEEDMKLNQQMATSPDLSKYLSQGLRDTIARPALTQSAKGILTAGPIKSVWYARDKLGKWLRARS